MRLILSPVVVPTSVALSFGVAFLGSYVTICLCEQLRVVCLGQNSSKLFGRKSLLFLMSVALGGASICGMHFVAMCGTKMFLADKVTPVNLSIDVLGVSLTLISVIACAFLGLYISSFDNVFTKSKSEVIELFVKEASNMSIGAIKKLKSSKILFIICSHDLRQLVLGGSFIGIGCFLMHYIGSIGVVATIPVESASAFRRTLSASPDTLLSPAYPVILLWDGGLLGASILVGFFLAIGSVWILYRLLSLYPNNEVLRLSSALLMAGASCSMHWVCMSSATFVLTNDDRTGVSLDATKISPVYVFNSFLAAGVLMSVTMFIVVLSDLRAWLYATTLNLHRADELIAELNKDTKLANSALMVSYQLKRRLNSSNSSSSNGKGHSSATTYSSGKTAGEKPNADGPNSKDSVWFTQFIYKALTPRSTVKQQTRNQKLKNNKVAVDGPSMHSVEQLVCSLPTSERIVEDVCGERDESYSGSVATRDIETSTPLNAKPNQFTEHESKEEVLKQVPSFVRPQLSPIQTSHKQESSQKYAANSSN